MHIQVSNLCFGAYIWDGQYDVITNNDVHVHVHDLKTFCLSHVSDINLSMLLFMSRISTSCIDFQTGVH